MAAKTINEFQHDKLSFHKDKAKWAEKYLNFWQSHSIPSGIQLGNTTVLQWKASSGLSSPAQHSPGLPKQHFFDSRESESR